MFLHSFVRDKNGEFSGRAEWLIKLQIQERVKIRKGFLLLFGQSKSKIESNILKSKCPFCLDARLAAGQAERTKEIKTDRKNLEIQWLISLKF